MDYIISVSYTHLDVYKRQPRNQGRILTGNEYLTVFNGLTGEAMKTIDYVPRSEERRVGKECRL